MCVCVCICLTCSNLIVLLLFYVLQLLQKGHKLVLEQIVTTIATVADSVEERFVPYYDRFMPSLKYIMANAIGKDYRMLRGKTIECISLIGLAVGQEKVLQSDSVTYSVYCLLLTQYTTCCSVYYLLLTQYTTCCSVYYLLLT